MPEIGHAQASGRPDMLATNNLFSIPPLTLTSKVMVAPSPRGPPTVGELVQQLRAALESKDYAMALECAYVGLETIPGNVEFLTAKVVALTKLHRFPSAIAAQKEVLAVEPNKLEMVYNHAELLLITKQIDEYRALVSKYKPQIDQAYDGVLSKYFSVVVAYQTDDQDQFRRVVTETLTGLPAKRGPLLGDWGFDEPLSVIRSQPDSTKKTMLLTFIRVLTGQINRDEALKTIKEL